jgi:hypothetical protein
VDMPGPGVNAPAIAVDKDGNVTAVWTHDLNTIKTSYASRMNRNAGSWSTPVPIRTIGEMGGGMSDMTLLAAPGGDVYAVWTEHATREDILMARYVAATARWESAVRFSALPESLATRAIGVAIDGKGVITLVSEATEGKALSAARFNTADGSWSTPVEIAGPVADIGTVDARLRADSAGNVVFGWIRRDSLNFALRVIRYSAQNAGWSAPRLLDDDVAPSPHALALGANGDALAAWVRATRLPAPGAVLVSRSKTDTDTWTVPVRVSGENNCAAPMAVLDAAGTATIIWYESVGWNSRRARGVEGEWTPVSRIAEGGDLSEGRALQADIAGNLTLQYVVAGNPMWMRYSATTSLWWSPNLVGRARSAEYRFTNGPSSVIDAAGNITSVWYEEYRDLEGRHFVVAGNRFQ